MYQELDILTRLINLREILFAEISKAFAEQELNSTEIFVIYVLQHKQKEIKAGDLAAELFLPMSTLTGIIDKMIDKGIVIRKRSDSDRRVVMIELNPEFQSRSESCLGKLLSIAKEISEETPPGWFQKFGEDLKLLEDIMEKRTGRNG